MTSEQSGEQLSKPEPETTASVSPGPGTPPLLSAVIAGIVGLAAGGIGLAVVTSVGEYFRLPPELEALGIGQIPPPEDQAKMAAGNVVLAFKNTALWLGFIGGILGASLGLTTGLLRRNVKSGVIAAVVAGLIGAVIGSVSGLSVIRFDQFAQANTPASELTLPEHYVIAMHGVTWLIMGLGIGLGVGLFRRQRTAARIGEAALVAGLAGLLGGVLFPVVAGILLPATNAAVPIPGNEDVVGRVLWILMPCGLIGFAAGRQQ